MKVALLNCYPEPRVLYSIHGKTVGETGLLVERIKELSEDVEIDIFDVAFNSFPEKSYDAFIISGSYFNPSREDIHKNKWIRNLISFVRKIHNDRIPLLGICFGHQILSISLGGSVFELPELEKGYKQIVLTKEGKNSFIFKGVPDNFHGVFYHKWAVYKNSLPFGSKLLALSPDIPKQVVSFSFEDSIGVQFHPERAAEDVRVMLNLVDNDSLSFEGIDPKYNSLVLKNFITSI